MVENSWNVSMRLMLDLPRETHRYLIEPLSNTCHIQKVLVRRFLKFLQQIRKFEQKVSKISSKYHCSSKATITEFVPSDSECIEYHPINNNEKWRVPFISEIIESKHKQLEILNIADEDLEEMLTYLCVS